LVAGGAGMIAYILVVVPPDQLRRMTTRVVAPRSMQ
jgi:hypothetical protein